MIFETLSASPLNTAAQHWRVGDEEWSPLALLEPMLVRKQLRRKRKEMMVMVVLMMHRMISSVVFF